MGKEAEREETQVTEKGQVGEENEEEQSAMIEEVMEEKESNFEAKDPLVEVNLGTEEEPRMTKISGLLLEESQDQLVQLIKKY